MPEQQEPASDGVSRPQDEAKKAPVDPFVGKGELLEMEDGPLFKAIEQIVKAQEPLAKNRHAKEKHWGRVRRGVPFSQLIKSEDRSLWRAELPPGISDEMQPIPNMADDLCRKIASQVLVDPPVPDPQPATDTDEDRGAAQQAKVFLKADGDESGTNDIDVFRQCIDGEMTRSSMFVHLWVDPNGGGWQPRQIKAHPLAVDASNPMVDPAGNPTSDHVLRYVTQDGQFTADPSQAQQQWLPKHQRDILLPSQVRTVPESADVHAADSVILLMWDTLGGAKKRFPELASVDDAKLSAMCDWRPVRPKAIVPPALHAKLNGQDQTKGEGKVSDSALFFWYHCYYEPCPDYPEGADIAVSGCNDGYTLSKATLRDDIPLEQGGLRPLLRDIPVAQFKCLHDNEEGDPLGSPAIALFGGANKAYAHIYGSVLEHMDMLLHPNVFLPGLSKVQSWQLLERTGQPIIVASKDDLPMYEDVNQLPSFTTDILGMLKQDMQQAAQLGDTAAGLDVSTSESGIAKQTVVQQAKVHLATIAQNFFNGVKRYWRIKLQLAQGKLTVPQQVQYSGADQAYKQRWFVGADFGGVKDVAIQAGSGTMMGPAEKQQHVATAQQMMWMDPDEAAEAGRSLMGEDLGLKPDPHRELIERQIAEWMQGPPKTWVPSQPQFDPMGQSVVDPNTGQPAMTPVWTPFEPRVTDEDPAVAKVRHRKLREFIATGEYSKQPPEWRQLADVEYQRMAYAAGVQTVRQQAEAQMQANAQAQQQANQQAEGQGQREDANAEKDRAFQARENQANRDAQFERTALQASTKQAA